MSQFCLLVSHLFADRICLLLRKILLAQKWNKECFWNFWWSRRRVRLSVWNFSRRFKAKTCWQGHKSLNGTKVSRMDARKWRMTSSQDDLPHQNLMISSLDWSSWSGMITDWQCQWLGKNSAPTGNQRSENLTGWRGNCGVAGHDFSTMTAH